MLTGKLTLITGAQKGIGLSLALAFAKSGSDIILHHPNEDALAEEAACLIRSAGRKVYPISGDFTREEDVMHLAEQSLKVRQVDILINNSACVAYKPLLDSDNELWDKVMDINAKAPFILTRQLAKSWVEHGHKGTILNITSISATLGTMYQSHYCASKGALLQLTRQSAIELGAYGIRVNAIAPGIIKTDANAQILNDPVIGKAYDDVVPLGHTGEPDDCADLAVFLCSDGARYISGQQFAVDGGWSARAGEPQFNPKTIKRE